MEDDLSRSLVEELDKLDVSETERKAILDKLESFSGRVGIAVYPAEKSVNIKSENNLDLRRIVCYFKRTGLTKKFLIHMAKGGENPVSSPLLPLENGKCVEKSKIMLSNTIPIPFSSSTALDETIKNLNPSESLTAWICYAKNMAGCTFYVHSIKDADQGHRPLFCYSPITFARFADPNCIGKPLADFLPEDVLWRRRAAIERAIEGTATHYENEHVWSRETGGDGLKWKFKNYVFRLEDHIIVSAQDPEGMSGLRQAQHFKELVAQGQALPSPSFDI